MTGNASPHFSWAELACHDGTPVPAELVANAIAVCDLAEVIRFMWGGPLIAVSGYRTPAYNKRIGGAPHSRHLQAQALDLRTLSVLEVPRLAALIRANLGSPSMQALGGWGIYPQWVHVDVRPRGPEGHIAFWEGNGVGSELA